MTKFKVGDKVKRTYDYGPYHAGMKFNEIGTVTESGVGTGDAFVYIQGHENWPHSESALELVKENTMEVTQENVNKHTIYVVKKGDGTFKKGQEVRMINNDGSSCPKFQTLDGSRWHHFYLSDLEVYNDIKEVTLEEVAKQFGISVESLRIKE